MPMPGDNTFGRRKGSYSPGDDNLDSTPYKPVPLAFQQADGTMPMETLDRNANKGPPPPPSSSTHRRADDRNRRKRLYIIAAVIIILLILLILILTLSICLGTDMCSSSSSSASPSNANAASHRYPHEGTLEGEFFANVYPQPGYVPFSRFVNASANGTGNATIFEEPFSPNSSFNHRRKREISDQRYDQVERYLIEKINEPILRSLKSTEFCGGTFDCDNLIFDEMKLEAFPDRDDLSYRFNVTVGSNDPIKITPEIMFQTSTAASRNFSLGFGDVFPGYKLGVVSMSFDTKSFCAYESVHCHNFTNIVDDVSTTTEAATEETTTETAMFEGNASNSNGTTNETESTNNETTSTVPDRSELLPPILQIFSTTTDKSSTTVSSSATGETTATHATILERDADVNAPRAVGLADCSAYGWVCANQVDHVSVGGRCDGIIQCPDGSDEKLCEQCRTSFSCPNGDGSWMCRRGKILCDGQSVCPTKYDESPMHCKSNCLKSEYNCRGSQICIPKSWLCDGDEQCPQGDDENGCDAEPKCNNHAFFCTTESRCLASWARCNGVKDCNDGSDEEHCSCTECSGNSTALCSGPNGRCILRRQVCDGRRDCPNGEDEMKCS